MKKGGRPARVAEQIKQEVAQLLMRGVKDPRVGFVSVMDVRMSPDLKYADVYVSLMGDDAQRKSSLIGLQQASGYMRREIGRRVRLRFTPQLRFHEDDTLNTVYHLEERLREIREEDEKNRVDE